MNEALYLITFVAGMICIYRFISIFVVTFVSLSSSTYISNENDHQVSISVTTSTASSTDFVIELHTNPITASGI